MRKFFNLLGCHVHHPDVHYRVPQKKWALEFLLIVCSCPSPVTCIWFRSRKGTLALNRQSREILKLIFLGTPFWSTLVQIPDHPGLQRTQPQRSVWPQSGGGCCSLDWDSGWPHICFRGSVQAWAPTTFRSSGINSKSFLQKIDEYSDEGITFQDMSDIILDIEKLSSHCFKRLLGYSRVSGNVPWQAAGESRPCRWQYKLVRPFFPGTSVQNIKLVNCICICYQGCFSQPEI